MRTVDRGKQREKLLERELEKLAGSNWQVRVLITRADSAEAHWPCALVPSSYRPNSTSHLPVSLAHSPREPLHLYFLRCSTLRPQPRLTVAKARK